jgi:pSer/pThr/pTyr-binding forkhead associated (FHA) protein
MIQLHVLSGRLAGDNICVRQFPFHIGRAPGNDLMLDEAGVWDRHLALTFHKGEGFTLTTEGGAFAAVNEEPQSAARLRNGDIISFGPAKIQFWLAAPQQRGLRLRELCVWLLLAGVTALQMFLLYRLHK